MRGKLWRRIGLVLALLLGLALLVVATYVAYIVLEYRRIPDGEALEIQGQGGGALAPGGSYTALSYNIGFGAYNHAFSFFMDSGTMKDGTAVQGQHARAQSREIVLANTEGALAVAGAEAPDFLLLQEVDTKADRSFHVNQAEAFTAAFPGYASAYASNFHTPFLAYPFHEPIGATEAGLLTLSRFPVAAAQRRSYPVDESFPTKFFDLDRCFSLLRLPVEGGGELVLINSHMSAYDEGGRVREAQMEMLCRVLEEERAKGHWVLVGGDFNHAFAESISAFQSGQQQPDWVYPFPEEALPAGFSLVKAQNLTGVATCRSTDIPYAEGVNYQAVLDGFIASENLLVEAENLDTGYRYSDHNPVRLRFTLAE